MKSDVYNDHIRMICYATFHLNCSTINRCLNVGKGSRIFKSIGFLFGTYRPKKTTFYGVFKGREEKKGEGLSHKNIRVFFISFYFGNL